MKFCSACGALVARKIPTGEDRERWVCTVCNTIHYQNPRMVVGCIIEEQGKLLLCKRAIEPRYGYWTVPAGFLELGESTVQGAIRETYEEANARVEIDSLYALYNIPHSSQVYMLFRARLLDANIKAGAETLEVRLLAEAEIPWDDIAFASIRNALTHYYADRKAGEFKFHMGTIEQVKKTA